MNINFCSGMLKIIKVEKELQREGYKNTNHFLFKKIYLIMSSIEQKLKEGMMFFTEEEDDVLFDLISMFFDEGVFDAMNQYGLSFNEVDALDNYFSNKLNKQIV